MGACLDYLCPIEPMKFHQVDKTQTSTYSKLVDENNKKFINSQYLTKKN